MKELKYLFQNPHNECESIYHHAETNRYYVLLPNTVYSKVLCTCHPYKGWYEADTPIKAGLQYIIDGKVVTTEEGGEIVDHTAKEIYENREIKFYQMKPEFHSLPNYEEFQEDALFQKLFDYMDPAHFDRVTLKRKEVFFLMGFWYRRRKD